MIRFAFDTETDLIPEDDSCPDMICLSWACGENSGVLLPGEGIPLLRGALENGLEIIGHNLPFDWRTIFREDPTIEPLVWDAYENGRVFDTLAAAQLDDISRGIFRGTRKGAYTLDRLAIDYLSEELDKGQDTWRLRYGELKGVPISQWPREATTYAQKDAIVPLRIRDTMHEPADTRAQSAHMFWLYLVAKEGVPTDQERVSALMTKVMDQAAEITRTLIPLGWVSVDKDGMHRHPSRVQLHMAKLGMAKLTKKGREKADAGLEITTRDLSIDEDACEKSGDPSLMAYARLGKLLDIINKDYSYLSKPIVRCSYGLAESGRSTAWGPNMQNLKTEVTGLE